MRTHLLEGRKREEQVIELGNMACHKQRLTHWKEEQVGELGNMAQHKQGLTCWRRGRGRSGLVSLETWHDLCVAETSVKLSCKKKSTKNHSHDLDNTMQCSLAAWLGTSALNQQFNIISLVTIDSLLCFPWIVKTHNAISEGLLLWFVVYNSIYKCKPIT